MQLMKYIFSALVLCLFMASCSRPMAKFTSSQSSTSAPSEVTFKNESKNGETYSWDFGDGNKSSAESPEHVFTQSGTFEVSLSAQKGKKKNIYKKSITVTSPSVCLVELSTQYGKMVIQLSDETPLHRDNFIKLVEEGFYDGLLFHRVMNGFMIQGGDPNSRNATSDTRLGSGGPGYQVPGNFNTSLAHVKGAIAAARQPDQVNPERKSSGSQFYIVHGGPVSESTLRRQEAKMDKYYSPEVKEAYLKNGGTQFLDGLYTVFGQVISGMEVIDKIAGVQTDGDPPQGSSRPKTDVKMTMKVIE